MIPLGISIVTTVWFTIGVMRDLRRFFNEIQTERVDVHDNGTVDSGRPQ